MVDVNQVYGSGEYLKAADLNNQRVVVMIEGVRAVTYDDGKTKLVLSFVGKSKALVLNKTNSTNIASMYGPETDAWVNKPITLYSTFVDFQGQSVPAVRIEPLSPHMTQAQAPMQQQPMQNGGNPFPAQQSAPLTPANEVGSVPAGGQGGGYALDDEVPF